MSTALSPFNASVTRVLELNGFPPELKTRDIQNCFNKYEDVRIKWVDDTTALIVFSDAVNAKRAYLQVLAYPPSTLSQSVKFKILPYDKADAQQIIHQVYSRHHPNSSVSNSRKQSISHSHQSSLTGIGLAGAPAAEPPQTTHVRKPSQSQPYNLDSSFGLPPLHKQQSLGSLISSSIPFNVPTNADDFQPPPSTSTAVPIIKPESDHLDPESQPFVPPTTSSNSTSE